MLAEINSSTARAAATSSWCGLETCLLTRLRAAKRTLQCVLEPKSQISFLEARAAFLEASGVLNKWRSDTLQTRFVKHSAARLWEWCSPWGPHASFGLPCCRFTQWNALGACFEHDLSCGAAIRRAVVFWCSHSVQLTTEANQVDGDLQS